MKTIVWDVDDVLNDLMRAWFEACWRPAHPDCPVQYDGLVKNPPHELLGVQREEYLASLDTYRLSPAGLVLKPAPEILNWFGRHGDRFRHVALTATPIRSAAASAAWVMEHFGRWVRTFHIVPSPRAADPVPTYDRTKEDFLRWWGRGDVLVEDNPGNAAAAQKLGIRVVLIARPWNGSRRSVAESLESLSH